VARLKEQLGKEVVLLGSGELVQSLMRRKLVEEYVLLTHPLALGSGHRLFPDGSPVAALRLVDTVATTTGVVIATYGPAETAAAETAEVRARGCDDRATCGLEQSPAVAHAGGLGIGARGCHRDHCRVPG